MVIRNSAGAIVGYFVFTLVLPTLSGLLAANARWWHTAVGWVDFNYAQSALFNGDVAARDWPTCPPRADSGSSSRWPSG